MYNCVIFFFTQPRLTQYFWVNIIDTHTVIMLEDMEYFYIIC